MRRNQNFEINHPTTLGFSFFIFFPLFLFLFFLSFCCSYWPSTRLFLSGRISEKAITRQEILTMDKRRVERGNFPLSFWLKFWSVLVHISSSINPITLVKVSLERSCPAPQFEHKCCPSRLKAMTSQSGKMSRSFTGGLGRFRCQWVKVIFKLITLFLSLFVAIFLWFNPRATRPPS